MKGLFWVNNLQWPIQYWWIGTEYVTSQTFSLIQTFIKPDNLDNQLVWIGEVLLYLFLQLKGLLVIKCKFLKSKLCRLINYTILAFGAKLSLCRLSSVLKTSIQCVSEFLTLNTFPRFWRIYPPMFIFLQTMWQRYSSSFWIFIDIWRCIILLNFFYYVGKMCFLGI